MNIGGTWDFPFGKLKCVEAVHSSSMPDGSYGGNPMGFILFVGGKTIYYAGDTALTLNMKLIGEFSPPDVALLPLGSNFTMDIKDAAVAATYCKARKVVGMHYDTFGFIKIDHAAAIAEFERQEVPLMLPEVGSSFEI
jgi:L-ascorbate metabolism protein UlaG (beta-lactamase superfamily)